MIDLLDFYNRRNTLPMNKRFQSRIILRFFLIGFFTEILCHFKSIRVILMADNIRFQDLSSRVAKPFHGLVKKS